MKNKGRQHKAVNGNCKGYLTFLTRPIESMGPNLDGICTNSKSKKLYKHKWSKRVRGYFKSQTKDILNQDE